MSARPLPVVLLVLVTVIATAGRGVAQDGSRGSDSSAGPAEGTRESAETRAAADYARGVRALEAGDAETARSAFASAVEADPRPDYALALAATMQQSGDLLEAIALYQRLLDARFGAIEQPVAEAIARARRAAEGDLASLEVRVGASDGAPPSPSLQVDERPPIDVRLETSTTITLDPGTHLLRARAGEWRSVPLSVQLVAGEGREVRLVLEPPSASEGSGDPAIGPALTAAPPTFRGPLVLGGLALAGGVTTAVLGSRFRAQLDQAQNAPSMRDAQPAIRRTERFARATNGMIAASAALAVAGIVWAIVVGRKRAASDDLVVAF